MTKDYKYTEVLVASSARQKEIDKMLRAAKHVEEEWKTALESADGIEINAVVPKLNASNGVIINAILIDTCYVFNEIANYLQEKMVEMDEFSSIKVFRVGDEVREKPIEFCIYPFEDIHNLFEQAPVVVKNFSDFAVKISNELKSFLTEGKITEERVESATKLCEDFITFINMETLFKPNAFTVNSVEPRTMYIGDAVIKGNHLCAELRKFIAGGQSVAEKFNIFSKKFAKPDTLPNFANMSADDKKVFFSFCRCIRNLTPATLAFAQNFVKIMQMAKANHDAIKFAVENI